MGLTVNSGLDRFILEVDLDEYYAPYMKQNAFHRSMAKHRLLGGAAGPGKTLALIMDHLIACNEFSLEDAPEVHTLLLRRTHPKLASTLITRFREKVPRELYASYNESKFLVTWLNGATTQFGSMQYEHDVFGWQGQWYKIGYDELTEFTFKQWSDIAAWNRCPVSPWSTRDGATNPIGVGADWVERLWVLKKPAAEMDENQRARYSPADYEYFPCTYLDNPIYANDPLYIANLDSYQGPISDALKLGKWGIAGGYFQGAWDEAYNVYPADSVELMPWWKRWLGGDWGFEHNSAIHWFCMDELGIVRIYRELIVKRHTAEELGECIIEHSIGPDGKLEEYKLFSFAHDAFAQKQDTNPIAMRLGAVLRKAGLPHPSCSTRDKLGRERLLYDMLRARVRVGEVFNDADRRTEEVLAAKLQIADCCENLIRTIPKAPRDEKNREEIAEFLGDDSLQSAGYGLYELFGKPHQKPLEVRIAEQLAEIGNPHTRAMYALRLKGDAEKRRQNDGRPAHSRLRCWRRL
ncbi:MAG: hypothetical protein WBC04_12365 [Candidatus Acidiferrales bacterium]